LLFQIVKGVLRVTSISVLFSAVLMPSSHYCFADWSSFRCVGQVDLELYSSLSIEPVKAVEENYWPYIKPVATRLRLVSLYYLSRREWKFAAQ